jgi:hypothetical protein
MVADTSSMAAISGATDSSGGSGFGGDDAADRNVEIWKIKKLIKSLEAARGCVLFLNSI